MRAQQKKAWFFLPLCWHRARSIMVLCLTLTTSHVHSELTVPVAKSRFDQPVNLMPYLMPINTPQLFSVPEKHVRWYQLDLYLEPGLPADWLLAFRRVPHKKLTLYLPGEQGYQPQQLGLHSTPSHHGPRAIPLQLTAGVIHRLYVKAQSPLPNQITPELWPASLYTLSEYRHYAFSASQQTVIAALLILALLTSLLSRNWFYLLPALHFASLGALLILGQGNIFRSLPAVDPGHTLVLLQAFCLLTALLCYQQLGQIYQRHPGISALLTSCHVLSVTLITGFTWQAQPDLFLLQVSYGVILLSALVTVSCRYRDTCRQVNKTESAQWQALIIFSLVLCVGWQTHLAVQAGWISAVLCLQAATLCFFYYPPGKNKRKPSSSVVMNLRTGDSQRRVFDNSLRQHLQPAPMLLDEEALTDQILTTLDAVLPKVPALLLTTGINSWHISSHHPRVARRLKKRLDKYQGVFDELIVAGPGSQVSLQDQNQNDIWAFMVFSEGQHHIILVIIPGQPQQELISWQQAVDISSHARTLFSASQQTRFWQLQASLDALTGLLNRNAFINEAESLLLQNHQKQQRCCVLFADIDNFKQINDRYGHPTGDKLLSQVAQLMRECLRQDDLLGRYGGEEFIIFLPGTSPFQGCAVAERIHRRLVQARLSPESVTISLGVAASDGKGDHLERLISEADTAMYQAKSNGKNRIERGPSCRDLRLQ